MADQDNPDQPPSNPLWKVFWFRPDLTEPNTQFEVKQGTFLDKFFTLVSQVDREDTEQEEWLRYGRKFYTKLEDDE